MGAAQIRWGGSDILGEVAAEATHGLRDALHAAVLPLGLPGSGPVRERREILLHQIDDYLLPRLAEPDRPLLIVVGGPTGVGKSTIVNTLVGQRVTQSGLIRPTTRSPVLIHHPADSAWFARDGILTAFDRVDHTTDDPQVLQLVPTTAVPRGTALLDAPDFDSIDDANRRLATRLLAAADMWLFVTSANRYADQVPWHQLDVARQRDTPLMVVLNRIQTEDLEVVSTDLVRQLNRRGIGRGKVVVVEHGQVSDGLLQTTQVDAIRGAIEDLSAAPSIRREIAAQCVAGALREAGKVADEVAAAAGDQVQAVGELLRIADTTYDTAQARLARAAGDGSVLRGALLARWHELVGTDAQLTTAELMQRVRDRGAALAPGQRREQLDAIELALDLALEALVLEHAEQAAAATSDALRTTPYGAALLDWSDDDLARPGRTLAARCRSAVAAWRRELGAGAAGVDESGTAARLLSLALAVGALTGPGAVANARHSLDAMLRDLLALERDRYLQPVMTWGLTPDAPHRVRGARRAIDHVVGGPAERKVPA
ncbi:GTPase domain-containing protein [Nocardioides sp. SLBN-35]|uniref:GTPase n=1 Tax=Nocardioides sp. SLBN-35 TaxID=2768445 RepID=UPI0011537235|nr:GTPase domain-containing protein [Nocardioides sp. SLBN-35]TQK71272.1 dynamin family protein [Nocardioides sp. SLBN-35]